MMSIFRLPGRNLLVTLLTLGLISAALLAPALAAGPPLPIDVSIRIDSSIEIDKLILINAIPIDEYWQQIEQTQALVASLENAPGASSHTQLLAAAARWENVTGLTLPDGTLIPIDHSFLVSRLRADPPDLAQLERLLTALLAARDAWPDPETAPLDTDALDQILAQPEFQWASEQPSPLADWWAQLQRRFWEFIARLLSSDSPIVGIPLLSYVLTGLGTLALVLVLAYVLRGLLADFVAETEIDPEDIVDQDMTAATALRQAQALSGEGDYRTAVRYLYLSSLLLLEERGLLRYDRSLTNREYLRSVAHLPQLAAIFRDVIQVFDRVWYGYQVLDKATYTRYADRVAELRRQK